MIKVKKIMYVKPCIKVKEMDIETEVLTSSSTLNHDFTTDPNNTKKDGGFDAKIMKIINK